MEGGRLTGSLALIVGVRGLAPAIAKALNDAGSDVAVASESTDAEDMLAARRIARRLQAPGTRTFSQGWDVTLPTNVQVGLRQVTKEFGRPPALVVYAADAPLRQPLTSTTDAQVGHVLQANLAGAIYLARAYTREVGATGTGTLAIALPAVGHEGMEAGAAIYAAARAGLAGLVEALALELRARGVRVVGLRPMDGAGLAVGPAVVELALGGGDHGQAIIEVRAPEGEL